MPAPPDREAALPVYVLVGGNSRRFGVDKAAYPVDGEPWALHVGRRLTQEDRLITLVGRESPAGPLSDVLFVPDATGVVGPLAGLLAAFQHRHASGGGRFVLASCDLVRPEKAWITPLLTLVGKEPKSPAAAYRAGDRWQPFPSVWKSEALEAVTGLIDAGVTTFQSLFDDLRAAQLTWPHDSIGPPQANRPADLEQLLRVDPGP